MKRSFDPAVPELMDLPQPVTPELDRDLANLRSLNRYFGSYRLVRTLITRWFKPGDDYRVLDLATGSGDIPRMMVEWCRARNIGVKIDAVDAQGSTIEIARRQSAAYPEIGFHQADALKFEAPAGYDLVCCSLALHHFSEADAVKLLQRCRDLSRRWVFVADLERSLLTFMEVYLVTALLYREPMTKSDGRTSVRRAFSSSELRQLAERAGWTNFSHRRFLFGRQAIWMPA